MRFWQSVPFLKILIPFTLGIFVGIYWQLNAFYFLAFWVVCFAFLFLIERYTKTRLKPFPYRKSGLLVLIALLCLGFFRVDSYRDIKRPNHFSKLNASTYKIEVLDFAESKYNFYRFKAKVLCVKQGDVLINSRGNALVYWDTAMSESPQMGSQYWVNAKFKLIPSPKNPNEFDYKEYLTYYNIYYKSYIQNPKSWVQIPAKTSLANNVINRLRKDVLTIFKKYLKDKEVYLMAQALILGGKNNLDEETKSHFAQTGTLHVLAVSGLHVGIIYLILKLVTSFLLKFRRGKWLRIVLVLLGVWLYAAITGLSPSVIRASTMFTLLGVGELFKGRNTAINSLFASAFIMLAINPYLIVNVGFQLSYAAVLGIMLIYQPIYQWLSFGFIKNKILWFLVDKGWAVCSISLAAQLATFPISVFYFGQFPSYFMFSNLFIIPAIFCLVCLALAILVSSPIQILAKGLAFLFHYIAKAVLVSVAFVSQLPFAYASGLHLEFWQVILFYLIIALLVYRMYHHRQWAVNLALILLVGFLVTVNLNYLSQPDKGNIVVHSVRNSNVVTVLKQNEATIIADSVFVANKSARKFYLAPYFRKHYVKKINTYVLKNKLAGFKFMGDTLVPFVYHSKYPNLTDPNQYQRYITWVLPYNFYTSKFAQKSSNASFIWTRGLNDTFSDTKPYFNLDSFAVDIAL